MLTMLLIFNVLGAFIILLPLSLLSIKLGMAPSFTIFISAYLLLLVAGIFAPRALAVLLPFSQSNYAWHQPIWFVDATEIGDCAKENFSPAFSLIYLTAVLLAETVLGVGYVKKTDLLSGLEGE